jgi:hypothetical protein
MKKKIVPYLLIILSLSFIIFVFYKDYYVLSFSLTSQYKKYYYLGILLFVISLTTLFINQKLLNNLFVVFVSLIISLQFVNLYFYIKGEGRLADKRLYFDVYFDLKEQYPNKKISVKYGPGDVLLRKFNGYNYLFPFSGISKSKTPVCNETGKWSIIDSDRYGFNNLDNEWDKPHTHSIFVGDSFTYGACVSEKNNIVGQFKNLLNKDEFGVINLGYLSNGPLLYYTTFKEYSKYIAPKHVFFLYWEGNDLLNLFEEMNSDMLRKYIEDKNFSQKLIERQDEIDNFWEGRKVDENVKKRTKSVIVKFLTFFHIREQIRMHKLFKANNEVKNKVINSEDNKLIIRGLEDIIVNFKKEVEEKNGKFYFVYLPDYQRFKLDENQKENHRKKNQIIKIINQNNIDLIDISNEFEKLKNPYQYYPFERDGHYNEEGYRFIANVLYKFID